MSAIIRWDAELIAMSSIAHGGQQLGTTTLLRREKVLLADGRIELVPVIAGNTVRGWLRRIGEDLLRSELRYEGQLGLAAAHALRGGGALAKTNGPALAGARLARLRALVPQIGVFGAAAGGTIVDGCLQVGKAVPLVQEMTDCVPAGMRARCQHSHFDVVQVETYARQDDHSRHAFTDLLDSGDDAGDSAAGNAVGESGRQMQFSVETLAVGTRLWSWMQLTWATPIEISFFSEVLAVFADSGRLGGRLGAGHGQIGVQLTRRLLGGADRPTQWRAHLAEHRDQAMEALTWLS